MQACRCVDNTRETPPCLRACANYHTHLPVIKRSPRQQLLGYQVGDVDDETTLQRGALDVAAKFMNLTEACSGGGGGGGSDADHRRLNTLA